jgi:hypothetical protein
LVGKIAKSWLGAFDADVFLGCFWIIIFGENIVMVML